MIQRNDVVRVKTTGEVGRVVGAGSELQVIVRLRGENLTKRFANDQLELVEKGESSI